MGASLMDARPVNPRRGTFTIAGAENLLLSLAGVVSARVVATPQGEVQEVHLLTSDQVTPKQTVRNVESALLAHFDMSLDHRKISVAQTFDQRKPAARPAAEPFPAAAPTPAAQTENSSLAADSLPTGVDLTVEVARPEAPLAERTPAAVTPPGLADPTVLATTPAPAESSEASFGPASRADPGAASPRLQAAEARDSSADARLMFVAFQAESRHVQQVRLQVELEWRGQRFRGQAVGADLTRSRMETAATACLRAVEAVVEAGGANPGANFAVSLDGVKTVEAFDHRFALVAVHAMVSGQLTLLTGSASIQDSPDKAVILATLQATDRWVRGRL